MQNKRVRDEMEGNKKLLGSMRSEFEHDLRREKDKIRELETRNREVTAQLED